MLPVVRVDFRIILGYILASLNLGHKAMIYQRFVCILGAILSQYKTGMRIMRETQLKIFECG